MFYKHSCHPINRTGFTLIEILIALFIFAIVAVITTMVLKTVVNTREGIDKNMDMLSELQIAIALMEQDFRQVTPRFIQTGLPEPAPFFKGTRNQVTLTHAGIVNPMQTEVRSSLARVSYFYQNGNLYRETLTVLDPLAQTKPIRKKILSHLEWIQFTFIVDNNAVTDAWTVTEGSALPRAVKLHMKIHNQGEMNLLFPLEHHHEIM